MRRLVIWLEKNAKLTCGADAFGDEVIDKIDIIEATYITDVISLCNYLNKFDETTNFADDMYSIETLERDVKNQNDPELDKMLDDVIALRKRIVEVIFGAKVLMNEGYATLGCFGEQTNDLRKRYTNACKIVRKLDIDLISQDTVLLALAGWKGNLVFDALGVRVDGNPSWDKDAMAIFDFKLSQLAKDEYSPVITQALAEADEMLFDYNKAQYIQSAQDDNPERQ